MDQGPAYVNAIDDNAGLLSVLGWIERYTDAVGFAANFGSVHPAAIAINVGADALSLANSVVQLSLAISNYKEAQRVRSQLDPAKADEFISKYEDEQWWAYLFTLLTIVAYVFSMADIVGLKISAAGEGVLKGVKGVKFILGQLEGLTKGLKVGLDAISAFQLVKGTAEDASEAIDSALEAYREVEPKVDQVMLSPEAVSTVNLTLDIAYEHQNLIQFVAVVVARDPITTTQVKMLLDKIPECKAWMKKKGYSAQ
jgi:hypothetical protein